MAPSVRSSPSPSPPLKHMPRKIGTCTACSSSHTQLMLALTPRLMLARTSLAPSPCPRPCPRPYPRPHPRSRLHSGGMLSTRASSACQMQRVRRPLPSQDVTASQTAASAAVAAQPTLPPTLPPQRPSPAPSCLAALNRHFSSTEPRASNGTAAEIWSRVQTNEHMRERAASVMHCMWRGCMALVNAPAVLC